MPTLQLRAPETHRAVLSVGDTVFIIPEASMRVVPYRVIEEIVRRSTRGEDTTHVVMGPTGVAVDIASVRGEIFNTAEACRDSLVDRATRSIEDLIKRAVDEASTIATLDSAS
jgi:hypothetical protein